MKWRNFSRVELLLLSILFSVYLKLNFDFFPFMWYFTQKMIKYVNDQVFSQIYTANEELEFIYTHVINITLD